MIVSTRGDADAYRTIFDLHADPLLILDARTGSILQANPAAAHFLHQDHDDLVETPFSSFLSAATPPDSAGFLQELRDQGRAVDQWVLVNARGEEQPTTVIAQSLPADSGPAYLITLRRPTAAAADDAARESRRDQLYGDIHDPLQEILSWIELEGNVRLKKPAQRLTEILKELRGHGFLPPPLPPAAGQVRGFDRRVPCAHNKVLIVDDETNIRNLFNNILRLNVPNLSLEMADNGRTAMHAFESAHHSLIILDMKMPAMDGAKVLLQLREICRLRCWQPPSVLLCSGYDSRQLAEEMTEARLSCAFLRKPVTKAEFILAVEEMLRRHAAP